MCQIRRLPAVIGANGSENKNTVLQLIEEFKQLLQQDNISPEQCHIGCSAVTIALSGVHAQLKDTKLEPFIPWLRIFLVWQVLVLTQVR